MPRSIISYVRLDGAISTLVDVDNKSIADVTSKIPVIYYTEQAIHELRPLHIDGKPFTAAELAVYTGWDFGITEDYDMGTIAPVRTQTGVSVLENTWTNTAGISVTGGVISIPLDANTIQLQTILGSEPFIYEQGNSQAGRRITVGAELLGYVAPELNPSIIIQYPFIFINRRINSDTPPGDVGIDYLSPAQIGATYIPRYASTVDIAPLTSGDYICAWDESTNLAKRVQIGATYIPRYASTVDIAPLTSGDYICAWDESTNLAKRVTVAELATSGLPLDLTLPVADNEVLQFRTLDGKAYNRQLSASQIINVSKALNDTGTGESIIVSGGDGSIKRFKAGTNVTFGVTASDITINSTAAGGGAVEGTAVLSTGEVGGVKFLREDGDGTCSWQAVAGGGNVSKVGTPLDNQVGVWTGDGTIEGTTGLTYDGTALNITGNITLSGTVDGIDIATDVAANTLKETNATHTGDVTGATALTIASTAISGKTLKSTLAGTEEILINDVGTLKKTTAQDIADLGGGGGTSSFPWLSASTISQTGNYTVLVVNENKKHILTTGAIANSTFTLPTVGLVDGMTFSFANQNLISVYRLAISDGTDDIAYLGKPDGVLTLSWDADNSQWV